jgi:AcrR family transcriptional regulator
MPSSSPQSRDHAGRELRKTVVGAAAAWPDVLAGEDLKPLPKQRRGHQARESILRVALALFAQNGYDATTVEEIAKTAGAAVGGFYRHFRSKRQVLLVLIQCLLDEFDASRSRRQFNESAGDAIERLRHGLKIRWKHEGVYRAWREAVVRDPALATLQAAMEAVVTANLLSTLEIAAASPGRRQGVDLVTLASIMNALFWRLLDAPGEREATSETITLLIGHALYEDAALGAVPRAGPGPKPARRGESAR